MLCCLFNNVWGGCRLRIGSCWDLREVTPGVGGCHACEDDYRLNDGSILFEPLLRFRLADGMMRCELVFWRLEGIGGLGCQSGYVCSSILIGFAGSMYAAIAMAIETLAANSLRMAMKSSLSVGALGAVMSSLSVLPAILVPVRS
ncbi:hypothetical protein Nepgr_023982 [Nepenthes gracilis]|uniref:Uncharacterized protein n=1 Tax=Nepenthes gracilis TaxID=150966 RepID=A0AAD3XZM1_NEPGR|nr:hypothetical protein Nepgr_023982 [Nepenthes gracilis]